MQAVIPGRLPFAAKHGNPSHHLGDDVVPKAKRVEEIAPNAHKRRRPGRPREQTGSPVKILEAAERLFAERGFAETTMREIAKASGVNQALIRYYFGNKELLFDTVFKRRGLEISGRRHVALDALEARDEPPSVRELLDAYLRPQWQIIDSGPGGEAFIRMQARLHTETSERAFRLRREVYDASVRRYIAAFRRALPMVSAEEMNWRMTFMIGTYLYMLAGVDRIHDFSDVPVKRDDRETVFVHLLRFIEGGMRAPDASQD